MSKRSLGGVRVLGLIFCTAAASFAQRSLPPVLSQVGIDQRLGEQVPLDAQFRDEAGRTVQLRDYFSGKPVLLSFVYYTCPMLCPMTLGGMKKAIGELPFNLGQEFVAVNVSINPKETPQVAAAKKEELLKDFDRPGAREHWHFLTGDEMAIQQVANAAGYHYVWDPSSEQFIHASGIMIATPAGKMARYYYGIEFVERDLRLGLMEAASEKIGSRADQVLLYCFHYDPQTGKYGLAVMNVIRIVGSVTVLVLVTAILIWLKRERRTRKLAVGRQPSAAG